MLGAQGGAEPPCGFWDLNPGPRQQQEIFFTTDNSPASKTSFYVHYDTIFLNQISSEAWAPPASTYQEGLLISC